MQSTQSPTLASPSTSGTRLALVWLSLLFLVSGFSALIYQIVWQRTLFTAFGVNIESITVVVAVFMFGLGVGSLVGGYLSHRFPTRLLHLFFVCELIIGLFGLASLPLIRIVGDATLHGSLAVIAGAVYALLCIPTIFMGATLPILSAYLHRTNHNVGRSVSTLYFFNTAGSALACIVTADILFVHLGQQASVRIAAVCNLLVGCGALVFVRKAAAGQDNEDAAADGKRASAEAGAAQAAAGHAPPRFWLVLALAAAVGYVALSQEIIWLRAISYATSDSPADFAHVLAAVLFGIALGSGFARFLCRSNPDSTLSFVAIMLFLSAVSFAVALPLFGVLLVRSPTGGMVAGFALVGVTSFLLGAVFPSLCHYAIRGGAVGRAVSWVYFANIVGSTAGPLLTGFVFFDLFPLAVNALILTFLTAALAALVTLAAPGAPARRWILCAGLGLALAAFTINRDSLFHHLFEKLHFKDSYDPAQPYKHIIENRSGVVAVHPGVSDVVYGGGVYDGQFNVDPVLNTNGITRLYFIPSLHPDPQEVLIVGLASGSWLRALTKHSGIKKFTVVEINPGYLEIIERYPEVAAGLRDPRVTLIIDDGRRWLNRNPDARFDLMIMNTTFHWRSHATNLLSDEFLRLCKRHLKPAGLVYYNATGSPDVEYTAAQVFRHVVPHANLVAAGDTPIAPTAAQRRQRLLLYHEGGQPLFTRDNALRKVLDALVATPIDDLGDYYRQREDLWHITDDNMASEFRARRK